MSYLVKNKAKRPIVCSLSNKNKTLRLTSNGSCSEKLILDSDLTEHIKTLATKGLVVLVKKEDNKSTKKEKNTSNSDGKGGKE